MLAPLVLALPARRIGLAYSIGSAAVRAGEQPAPVRRGLARVGVAQTSALARLCSMNVGLPGAARRHGSGVARPTARVVSRLAQRWAHAAVPRAVLRRCAASVCAAVCRSFGVPTATPGGPRHSRCRAPDRCWCQVAALFEPRSLHAAAARWPSIGVQAHATGRPHQRWPRDSVDQQRCYCGGTGASADAYAWRPRTASWRRGRAAGGTSTERVTSVCG